MSARNPLKHTVKTISNHARFIDAEIATKLKLTEAQLEQKLSRPSWKFVRQFAAAVGCKVEIKVEIPPQLRSSDSAAVHFEF